MSKRWTQADIDRLKPGAAAGPDKVKLPAVSSSELTKAALRMLGLQGYHVWRQNNAGVYDNIKKVWRANSSTPGISDIIGFHKRTGQFIACEIKAGSDRLSEEQVQFLENVKQAGGVAIVIRTMDDVELISRKIKSRINPIKQ